MRRDTKKRRRTNGRSTKLFFLHLNGLFSRTDILILGFCYFWGPCRTLCDKHKTGNDVPPRPSATTMTFPGPHPSLSWGPERLSRCRDAPCPAPHPVTDHPPPPSSSGSLSKHLHRHHHHCCCCNTNTSSNKATTLFYQP